MDKKECMYKIVDGKTIVGHLGIKDGCLVVDLDNYWTPIVCKNIPIESSSELEDFVEYICHPEISDNNDEGSGIHIATNHNGYADLDLVIMSYSNEQIRNYITLSTSYSELLKIYWTNII